MTQRAITIGVFDGVHLGHAALVGAARRAVGRGGRVTALAFDPHPVAVLRPGRAPAALSTFAQRRRWLTEAGVDEVVALEPTPQLLELSPQSFLERVMAEHDPDAIVEGPDFRFGHDRAGSVDTLRALEPMGFRTVVADERQAVLTDRTCVNVKSSLIRRLVGCGRVRDAALLLGRPYELVGDVVRGDGRGAAELGVATANLDHGALLLPADGIYLGVADVGNGRRHPAAISIGSKPTFGECPRVCEAHLIGYEDDGRDYGWPMRLELHDWLRDQLTYTRVEPLIEQIRRDVERVTKWSAAGAAGRERVGRSKVCVDRGNSAGMSAGRR